MSKKLASASAKNSRGSQLEATLLSNGLTSSEILVDRLNHLVADLRCLSKTRSKVALDPLELLTVAVHVA